MEKYTSGGNKILNKWESIMFELNGYLDAKKDLQKQKDQLLDEIGATAYTLVFVWGVIISLLPIWITGFIVSRGVTRELEKKHQAEIQSIYTNLREDIQACEQKLMKKIKLPATGSSNLNLEKSGR